MNRLKSSAVLYNSFGNPLTPVEKIRSGLIDKKALGLFPNIYQYPEVGNFRPRFYTLSDTEQGLDTLSRELLVRWSREMFGQLPFVSTAANLKATFSVGNAYLPEYKGSNSAWGERAAEWLVNNWYADCCTRGYAYDFRTALHLLSFLLDQDGDILMVFTKDEVNRPRFQIIASHRVRCQNEGQRIEEGRFKGCVIHDGVIYTPAGKTMGFHVVNPPDIANLVDYLSLSTSAKMLSTREARLIYDPKFFDKGRGIPAISPAILHAISIQELYSYIQERVKIESCVGLVEKTVSGEGPFEYANVLDALNQQNLQMGQSISPTTHGVQVVQGPSIRYVKADPGCDIKSLSSNTPGQETSDFLIKLETQIIGCMGVPHQLIYSPGSISGRIVSGIGEVFRAKITERQQLLDKYAKLLCGWALANAMENGELAENYDENLFRAFTFTHPQKFTFDEGYERKADLEDLAAGVKSLNDITSRYGRTANEVLAEREKESLEFFQSCKRVSEQTGIDINIVIQQMNEGLKSPVAAIQSRAFENGNKDTNETE